METRTTMKKILIALPLLAALAACGKGDEPQAKPSPSTPDYKKMTSVTQVETVIPENLKIPYQQLFSCTFDLAAKQKKPTPAITPEFAGGILETVRKDPTAGEKCLAELRKGDAAPKG
jgi:hypothetical protein